MAQSRPNQAAPNPGLDKVAKNIGTTAKILVELNKSLLLKPEDNFPDNHPMIKAIRRFTMINCRTAQLSNAFLALPDTRSKHEQVETGLGKLKTIPTPTAKTSSELFTTQFKGPSDSMKQALASKETIRNEYKTLVSDQHERIVIILDRIRSAKDPVSMLKSQDISNEFSGWENRRGKVFHELTNLDKALRATLHQLDSLFTQIYHSIPLTERKGLAPTSAEPEKRMPE